jgi:hypothetical protein
MHKQVIDVKREDFELVDDRFGRAPPGPPPGWRSEELPRLRVKPNCKSGIVLALREVNLWLQRERAFEARQAGTAAAYAREQQAWWKGEARRLLRESRRGPMPARSMIERVLARASGL